MNPRQNTGRFPIRAVLLTLATLLALLPLTWPSTNAGASRPVTSYSSGPASSHIVQR